MSRLSDPKQPAFQVVQHRTPAEVAELMVGEVEPAPKPKPRRRRG